MDNYMKIVKEIAFHTSTKAFYDEAKLYGERASKTKDLKNTQLQNLMSIADFTFKVTDILNYIKNQASKHRNWNTENFANDMLNYLDHDGGICEYKKKIIESENLKEIALNEYDKQDIYLKICREFIKQMLIHFNFEKSKEEPQNVQ